jgi:regulator of sigma E protease
VNTFVTAFAAFAGFAILIILHEAGHFAAAKAVGMRVEKFMLFFGKPLVGFRRGETYYGVGWIPAGGFVKITGMNPHEELDPEVEHRAYFRQKVWKRLVVIGAGPAVNLVLAFLILAVLFLVRGAFESNSTVETVQRASPAAEVLRPGDRIVAVDGERGTPGELRQQLATHRCRGDQVDGCRAAEPALLTVQRGGAERSLRITPVYDAEARRPLIGFTFGGTERDVGVGEASRLSADTMWQVTEATVGVIVRLFYSPEARNEVGGVVGSYETTRRAFDVDVEQAIFILGLISLSLAVVNLFPFLPLDGGHIFWAIAEKVRGRSIPFSVMERASVVGFVLIMLLFAIGLENDIDRIRNDELGIR